MPIYVGWGAIKLCAMEVLNFVRSIVRSNFEEGQFGPPIARAIIDIVPVLIIAGGKDITLARSALNVIEVTATKAGIKNVAESVKVALTAILTAYPELRDTFVRNACPVPEIKVEIDALHETGSAKAAEMAAKAMEVSNRNLLSGPYADALQALSGAQLVFYGSKPYAIVLMPNASEALERMCRKSAAQAEVADVSTVASALEEASKIAAMLVDYAETIHCIVLALQPWIVRLTLISPSIATLTPMLNCLLVVTLSVHEVAAGSSALLTRVHKLWKMLGDGDDVVKSFVVAYIFYFHARSSDRKTRLIAERLTSSFLAANASTCKAMLEVVVASLRENTALGKCGKGPAGMDGAQIIRSASTCHAHVGDPHPEWTAMEFASRALINWQESGEGAPGTRVLVHLAHTAYVASCAAATPERAAIVNKLSRSIVQTIAPESLDLSTGLIEAASTSSSICLEWAELAIDWSNVAIGSDEDVGIPDDLVVAALNAASSLIINSPQNGDADGDDAFRSRLLRSLASTIPSALKKGKLAYLAALARVQKYCRRGE